MVTNFVRQSKLPRRSVGTEGVGASPRPAAGPRPLTSAQWLAYFRANAARPRPIPWGQGAGVPPEELAPVARSLQAWQLGEPSDGRHLRAAAARHAEQTGDPDYLPAVELFIREEQRHGA